jgi:ADP-heptose:LPS heptosyltransferase
MQFIPARHRVGICGSSDNLNASQQQFYKEIYSRQMDASPFAWNLPELERNRMFLQFLGIHASAEDNWPKFWTESTDRDAADRLFAGLTEGCVIGIAPGISWPLGKRLPARWYAETLQKLQISDVHTVLLGSSQDSEICAEIETFLLHDRFNAKVINLAGKTTPLQLVECIRRCDLLLCADAAPLHIATAMRKPVVGILGGGHYGRFYPWGDPKLANVVNNPLDCYGCNWQCKYDTVRCIQEIPPADATQKLKDLFEYVLQTDKAETTNSIIL